MKFKERKINDLQKWRRGWDLNSVAPFILRKLLILHKATIARTATVAQVGYSFGTHSLSWFIQAAAAGLRAISLAALFLAAFLTPSAFAQSRYDNVMFLREENSNGRLATVAVQAPRSSIGEPIGERNGVNILPEPREAMPGDKPGAMWSVGREDVLPAAARRGAPGAGYVLRNTGQSIIYLPREGVGFPGPRVATPESIGEPINTEASPPAVQTGGIGDPIGVRRQEQYERILSDPSATEEERSTAAEMIRRLRSYR
jgi:hypothetical protein